MQQCHRQVVNAEVAEILERTDRLRLAAARQPGEDDEPRRHRRSRRPPCRMGSSVTSTPSSSTRPESGAVSPTTIENVVVLPAPLAPSRPITSPEAISMLTPLTTVLPLYDLVRSVVASVDIQCDPGLEPQGTL